MPDWVDLVKLGKHKELAPSDENWFYIRAGKSCKFFVFFLFLITKVFRSSPETYYSFRLVLPQDISIYMFKWCFEMGQFYMQMCF